MLIKGKQRLNIRFIDDSVNKWLFQKRLEKAKNDFSGVRRYKRRTWKNIKRILLGSACESLIYFFSIKLISLKKEFLKMYQIN